MIGMALGPSPRGGPVRLIRMDFRHADTLSARFPLKDRRILPGAILEVAPDQVAQAVYLGAYGDAFGPGRHPLRRETMPVTAALDNWPFGPEALFELDLYFLRTTPVGAVPFWTDRPVPWSRFAVVVDRADAGAVSVQGDFNARITDPRRFLTEVAGAEEEFSTDEFSDSFRLRALAAVAGAALAANLTRERWRREGETLGPALLPAVAETCRSEYGLELTRLRLTAEDAPVIPAVRPNPGPVLGESLG